MIAWLLIGSAWALDLADARRTAADRALEVQRAEAEADAARARAGAALGEVLPAVVVFADGSAGAGFTSFGFERPVAWQLGAGLEGTWTVIDPSGWIAAAAARRSASGRRALLSWARVTAIEQATTRYMEARTWQEQAEIRRQAADDAEHGALAVASLVDAGLRPPVDRARATAAAAGARAALAEARASATAGCASLQGLLGEAVDGVCELAPVAPWAPRPPEGPHPAVEAAREAWRATRSERGAARWALGPAVALRGTAATYAVPGTSGPGWSVGARAEAPLFSGQDLGDARAAGAMEREAERGLEAQRIAIAVARVAAIARLDAAREAQVALDEADAAAREAFRLTDERYLAGLDGVTPWLDARRARDEAAVASARGRARLGVALAALESANGVATP